MTSPWQFKDGTATANAQADVSIAMNPVQPIDGIKLGRSGEDAWNVFAIKTAPEFSFIPEEIYVREQDLIARFKQSAADQFALQLNWRIVEMSDARVSCIELWASIQTDLLDTHPVVIASCASPKGGWEVKTHCDLSETTEPSSGRAEVMHDAVPAALIARSGDSVGVWMIERTDQQDAELLSPLENGQQDVELFGHFMEKGVIRRARMRFYTVAGELSEASLRELYQEFCASPLPLTA